MFRHALVRPPAASFADGLTVAGLGMPSLARALEQHQSYCQALERGGLTLVRLSADPLHPDATFVEDTAILTPKCAILTRPGAESRRGEVASVRAALTRQFQDFRDLESPATVDGGDVCQVDEHFLIGISHRTNEAGAVALTAVLEAAGYTASCIDIRSFPNLLHLKSGMSYLGEGLCVALPEIADHLEGRPVIRVDASEAYAANCLRINRVVLIPQGAPRLRIALEELGRDVVPLDMSEFRKQDGGLSCLSLRW